MPAFALPSVATSRMPFRTAARCSAMPSGNFATPGGPARLQRDLALSSSVTNINDEIERIISENELVLFMKGTSFQPRCGFSRMTLGILESIAGDRVKCVDVLDTVRNPGLREAIKSYSSWPTIPQLYLDAEFIGGCDIVQQLASSGQLQEMIEVALAQ